MFRIFKSKQIEKIRDKSGKTLSFEDINLEVYIRNTTGIKSGEIYESDVTGIKKLDFKGWPLISIRGIEAIVNLEELILYQSKMNNISFLKNLTKLRRIDLSWSDSISEIESLKKLINLEELAISYSSGLKNFYVISELKALRKLDLSENFLYDNSFLKNIDWINEVNLSKNNLSEYKIESENIGLRNLDISANIFNNLEFVKMMPNIEQLDISVNKISDISPLKFLKKIHTLDMRGNQIEFSKQENKETLNYLKAIKCKIKK